MPLQSGGDQLRLLLSIGYQNKLNLKQHLRTIIIIKNSFLWVCQANIVLFILATVYVALARLWTRVWWPSSECCKPTSLFIPDVDPLHVNIVYINQRKFILRNLGIGKSESWMILICGFAPKSKWCGLVKNVSDVVKVSTHSPLVGEVSMFKLQVIRLALVRREYV